MIAVHIDPLIVRPAADAMWIGQVATLLQLKLKISSRESLLVTHLSMWRNLLVMKKGLSGGRRPACVASSILYLMEESELGLSMLTEEIERCTANRQKS